MTPLARSGSGSLFRLPAMLGILLVWPGAPARAQAACRDHPLAVQVLGSGGPFAGGDRASSGYLVWRDGRAAVMVDAGGGTFLRFGEAGATLDELSLLAVSHLHPDHVADLPALLWLSEMARRRPLPIAGPFGGGGFPPFDRFLARLFDSTGAFPVLSGALGGGGQGVPLDVTVVDEAGATPRQIYAEPGLTVTALPVPHGAVPTIGYRVEARRKAIVFGSDQNGTDPAFAAFARGADLLVMHLAIAESAPPPIARLHARPSIVGDVARAAGAGRLLLSHLMEAPASVEARAWFSLAALDQAVALVRERYPGPIELAMDLGCFPIE
ncbi:MAG: MBL fold metallo-hydrolase [Gemmatimonadales bacterium]